MNTITRLFAAALLATALSAHAEPCKVNVHDAGPAQLALLPGIGPKTAGLISLAKPATLAELDAVKGVGPKKLAIISPYVTFAGPTTCTEKQHAPKVAAPAPKN